MKTLLFLLSLTFMTSSFALTSGAAAPGFTLKNAQGRDVSLSDFKGKIVVLEWYNKGCPFVRKHYDSGNMQGLQKTYTGQGVTWLSIVSSAEGNQGFLNAADAMKEKAASGSNASEILLDTTGSVGKLYEAKTTPHMFVIDQKGMLAYQGAIDDHADTEKASVPASKNYVAQALKEVMENKKVSQPATKSYGCSVKY